MNKKDIKNIFESLEDKTEILSNIEYFLSIVDFNTEKFKNPININLLDNIKTQQIVKGLNLIQQNPNEKQNIGKLIQNIPPLIVQYDNFI